jgi:L-malate glycosyltransferase
MGSSSNKRQAMAESRKKLVFFTPSLERTGSEIVLFNLLPFAADYEVTVISKYRGALFDHLPSNIHKAYLYKESSGIFSKIVNRIRAIVVVPKILAANRDATWYVNTIVLPEIISYAKMHSVPVILHLHELEQMFALLSADDVKKVSGYPSLVIANSGTSAEVLSRRGRLEKTAVIYPGIDIQALKLAAAYRDEYRKKMGLKDEFLWVMCGTLDNNKNPLLFIKVAKELKRFATGFRMAWIGGSPGGDDLAEKVKRASTEQDTADVVVWLGNKGQEFYRYFSCADGLILTSEFESFSMVTAEAMAFGIPVVANNCGGVSEIIEKGAGLIVEKKNSAFEMATKMKAFMDGKEIVDRDLQRKIAGRFSKERIGEEWKELMKKWIK